MCDFDMWQSESGDGSSGSLVLFSTMYFVLPCVSTSATLSITAAAAAAAVAATTTTTTTTTTFSL